MKKAILIITAVLFSMTSFAQNPKLPPPQKWDADTLADNCTKISNIRHRLTCVEKELKKERKSNAARDAYLRKVFSGREYVDWPAVEDFKIFYSQMLVKSDDGRANILPGVLAKFDEMYRQDNEFLITESRVEWISVGPYSHNQRCTFYFKWTFKRPGFKRAKGEGNYLGPAKYD